MDTIKHLENKFSIARYELIVSCEANELQLYLFLKLYAINKHNAYPGRDLICKQLDWGTERLTNTIKDMEAKGRLKVERKFGSSNDYDITWYDSVTQSGSETEQVEAETDKTCSETRRRETEHELITTINDNREVSYESEEVTSKQFLKQQSVKNKTNLLEPAIQYYKAKTKEAFDFIPGVDMGGRTMLSHFLKEYSMKEWEDYVDYYYHTPKTPFYEEKITPNLKTLLSISFINQWKQNK